MKHRITLSGTVIVTTEQLSALAGMGIPMTVMPVIDKDAPVRRRAKLAAAAPAPAEPVAKTVEPVAKTVEPVAKKPGRPRKVKPTEAAAAAPVEDKPDHSRESVLARFSDLIDTNFDAAARVLEQLKVAKFSEVTDDQLPRAAELIAAA